jgi:hypothetical protein
VISSANVVPPRLHAPHVTLGALLGLVALACGDGAGGELTSPPSAGPNPGNEGSRLGYNLDFPGDWSNLPPFIDLMKNTVTFAGDCPEVDADCDRRAHLDLDAQGWVRSLRYVDDPSRSYRRVGLPINTSDARPDVGQTFVVTWEGNGEVTVPRGRNMQRQGQRRFSFELGEGATFLYVESTGDDSYPKNIRVFQAASEALLAQGEQFDPAMLEYLKPFASVRFMDWMQSNEYGRCVGGTRSGERCYAVIDEDCGGVESRCMMPGTWSERPTAEQRSLIASGQFLDNERPELGNKVGGYALETMIALANALHANPQFAMPIDSDEEYVTRFAETVRDTLDPSLRAQVELSNEVWNWGFPQASYANVRGRELWPDEGSAWVQYMAGRTDRMCGTWKEAFEGQEQRLRCLISPQTGWRDLAETVLECPAWRDTYPAEGRCYDNVDAINITGYFSGCLQRNPEVVRSWLARGREQALDLAFDQLLEGGLMGEECQDNLANTIRAYSFFQNLASERQLELYVYESGTHFDYGGDDGDDIGSFLVELTRDPRMYEAYLRNFEGFMAAGGNTMNVWGWLAPNDMWANADSVSDRSHPKYRAIVDFVRQTEGAD